MKWRIGNTQWSTQLMTDEAIQKRISSIPMGARRDMFIEADEDAAKYLQSNRSSKIQVKDSGISATHAEGVEIQIVPKGSDK